MPGYRYPVARHSAVVPAVSVVMPVHNALPHLDAAVESILRQTFPSFEFVILDDASTDGSRARLREWAALDPRIRLVEVARNLGPAVSSDRVARLAVAPIVARMDADDISYPTRLEEQVKVLEKHPEAGVVGGLSDIIDAHGRKIRQPEPWRLIRRSIFSPFGNGSLTYRREIFERIGGYRRECEFWEDFDLIVRMAAVTKILVIPHAIYQVRQSTTSTRIVSEQDRVERGVDLMYRSSELLERNCSYDHLLNSDRPAHAKLDPRVFISLGSMVLWAGGKPRLCRRLLRRGKIGFDVRTLVALVWTSWASLSPATLRSFLRLLLIARNVWARRRVDPDRPVEWRPRVGARIPVDESRTLERNDARSRPAS